jgi:hypothetical protein
LAGDFDDELSFGGITLEGPGGLCIKGDDERLVDVDGAGDNGPRDFFCAGEDFTDAGTVVGVLGDLTEDLGSVVVFGVEIFRLWTAFVVEGNLTGVGSVVFFGVDNERGERGGMGVFGVITGIGDDMTGLEVVGVEGPATTIGATVFLGVGAFLSLSTAFSCFISLAVPFVDWL